MNQMFQNEYFVAFLGAVITAVVVYIHLQVTNQYKFSKVFKPVLFNALLIFFLFRYFSVKDSLSM